MYYIMKYNTKIILGLLFIICIAIYILFKNTEGLINSNNKTTMQKMTKILAKCKKEEDSKKEKIIKKAQKKAQERGIKVYQRCVNKSI